MSGGYPNPAFSSHGNCGRSNKTFNLIFGSSNSPANKKMAGGGMQKYARPSSIGRSNSIFNYILKRTSSRPEPEPEP